MKDPRPAFTVPSGTSFLGLQAAFARAGYTRDAIQAASAMPVGFTFDLARALRSTADGSPASLLIRLFVLGRPIEREALARIISPTLTQTLERSGLLLADQSSEAASAGPAVRAAAALAPTYGTLVVRDFESFVTGKPMGEDHVLGTGMASTLLSKLTPRSRQGDPMRVLDIGTGQGLQAILAAAQGHEVVGTDINPRALNCAALGAAINGVREPEWRLGSYYEPVAAESTRTGTPGAGFDLIVCNPPFVISPRDDLVCMGGSQAGGGAVEHIVTRAPEYLREGGFAVFIGNWFHRDSADWSARPRAWVVGENAPCDAWVIRFNTIDPEAYARGWIQETALGGGETVGQREEETLAEWMAYYDKIGAGAITFGAIVLRRRDGANWWREDTLPMDGITDNAGDQVRRIFDNTTLVRSAPNAGALLDLPLMLNPDHELEQHCRLVAPPPGIGADGIAQGLAWRPIRASLRQTRGFAMTVSVDELVMRVLQGWDGRRPAADLIRELAREMGAREEDAIRQSGPVAARLLLQGHLVVGADR